MSAQRKPDHRELKADQAIDYSMHSCCYLSVSLQHNENGEVITIRGCCKYQIPMDRVVERPPHNYTGFRNAEHEPQEHGTDLEDTTLTMDAQLTPRNKKFQRKRKAQ